MARRRLHAGSASMVLRKSRGLAALGLGIEIEPMSEDGKAFHWRHPGRDQEKQDARARVLSMPTAKCLATPISLLDWPPLLRNSVLYAERVDVGNDRLPTLGECNGFDAFFFRRWHFGRRKRCALPAR